jgi:hypothetical protein
VTDILEPFPAPGPGIRLTLNRLAILHRGDPREMHAAGDLTNLPHPWEPDSCPDELRDAVWSWCSAVGGWINTQYAWRPTQMIPPCWPLHPHIARELPTLAVLRWEADVATSPDLLEEWHRYTLPLFLDRMAGRLGESTCRTAGKHQDWPAAGRVAAFTT